MKYCQIPYLLQCKQRNAINKNEKYTCKVSAFTMLSGTIRKYELQTTNECNGSRYNARVSLDGKVHCL